jgi:hypothetical protein
VRSHVLKCSEVLSVAERERLDGYAQELRERCRVARECIAPLSSYKMSLRDLVGVRGLQRRERWVLGNVCVWREDNKNNTGGTAESRASGNEARSRAESGNEENGGEESTSSQPSAGTEEGREL